MTQEEKKKNLEQKYMEFQMMEQQLKQMEENLQQLDAQLMEITAIQKSITELGSIKPNTEVFVPVSTGIFVKGTITDASTLLVNVGNNVIVDKTAPETVDLLEKQVGEVTKMRQKFASEMNKLALKMAGAEAELQKLIANEG